VLRTLEEKDKRYWVISPKDGNGLNCDASNLELIHVQERMNKSIREKRNTVPAYKTSEENKKKGIKKMARTHWIRIKQYTLGGKYKTTYASIKEAAKKTGVSSSNIVACAKGNRRRGDGYVWRYEFDGYVL